MGKEYKRLKIVQGLGVPQNTSCTVVVEPDAAVFLTGGAQYRLALAKIEAVEIQQDIEQQVYSKGSLAGGLLGGALFGVAGAVIGSAPKKKTAKTTTWGVAIAYESGAGAVDYLILSDITPNDTNSTLLCRKLKNLLKKQPRSPKTIEL